MQYLLYPIAIYIFLIFIRYFITFLQLCKSQFQYPSYQVTQADTVPSYLKDLFETPIQELEQLGFKPFSYLLYQPIYPSYQVTQADTVPSYLKDLFETPIQELEQLGFKPFSYLLYQPMVKVYQQTNWEILLYNKTLKSYATVVVRRLVEPVNLFDIEFYTFFKEKTLLLTVNGKAHGLIGEIPHTIVQDVYTDRVSVFLTQLCKMFIQIEYRYNGKLIKINSNN